MKSKQSARVSSGDKKTHRKHFNKSIYVTIIILASLVTATAYSTTSIGASIQELLFGKTSDTASLTQPATQFQQNFNFSEEAEEHSHPSSALTSNETIAARSGHTATALGGGQVLLVGGDGGGTAEIYDAGTQESASTYSLITARSGHTATKLGDGRVLVTGGSSNGSALSTTEIYDSASGFSAGANLGTARSGHTATVLSDGRVLVTGGDAAGTAEIYDPVTGTFSSAGNLTAPRSNHSAVLMNDGRVFIAGGNGSKSAEIFNPADGSFTAAGNEMTLARAHALLRVLPDGKVQIIGGNSDGSMEVYDPAIDTVGAYAHVVPESDPCANLINYVLSAETRSALIYNGAGAAERDRSGHTVTELGNTALVIGGTDSGGNAVNTVTVFSSSSATVTTDKLDYAPGETVTISGTGFAPGETVRVKIHEDPHTPQERGFDVTADENGNFTGTYVVMEYDLNMKFIVGARGLTSGRTAQTTFTDGPNTRNIRATTISPITVTINAIEYTSTTNCTGASNDLGPFPLTSASLSNITDTNTNNKSVKLTAPATPTSPGGYTFSSWTSPTGGTATVLGGDPKVVCISGTNGNVTDTFIPNYIATNSAPTNIALSPSSINENAGANATVGNFSTTDPDVGDTFTYTLVSGAGDTDNGAFNISTNTLRANASFDFETKSSYTVRVRSTDAGGLFTEKQFTVTVLNVNETPTDIALSNNTILENAGANAAVGNFSTTDPDAGDTFTYTLVSGTGDTDNGAFNISGNTLQANASFDFETKNSYTVRVRSTDAGGLFTEKQFTITVLNVNETPTDIALSPSSINENAAANTTVGNFSTTDPDVGDTFTYTLVSGTGDSDNGAFNILGNALRANASFDFETKNSYTVRVRSTDAGGLFTEKQFTISINDVNEAPTDIDLSDDSLDENAGADAPIGTLSGTDPDVGQSATLTFSLPVGVDDNNDFNILGNSLRANASFDFETKNSYTITVRATDTGGLTYDEQFTISVDDVNEEPTDIDLSPSSINENAGADAPIGTLSGTDPDAGQSATLTFSLPAGVDDNSDFNISTNTLRANASFDFETKSSYTITVRATDTGGLTYDEQFTVNVNDVNDAPVLTPIGSKNVNEETLLSFTANATDEDMPAQTLMFSLVGDVPTGANITSGGNFTWTPTEAQGPGNYTFDVCVSDGDLNDCETIEVTVNEVNVAPVLALIGAQSGNEGSPLSFTAMADDDDIPANTLTFSLVGAPVGASIDSGTGEFSWTPGDNGSFPFTVKVCDNGSPVLCDDEYITVTVNNVAPTVNAPVVSPEPSLTGNSATASATFSDPGANDAPFTCTVNYGNGGGDVAGTVVGNSCTGPANVYTLFGMYTVTIKVTDKDGSTGMNSSIHTVNFNFNGFFQPIDNLPAVNKAQAGSAIPVKFSLGGYQGLNIFMSGYPNSGAYTCNSTAPLVDIEETVNPGSSTLTYDPLTDRYHYVWKTQKSWANSCRQLVIVFADGSVQRANFQFKK